MAAAAAANSSKPLETKYYQGVYGQNHYAMQPWTLETPGCVCLARYDDGGETYEYALALNPTDARGLRLIGVFIKNKDPGSVLNREYSDRENSGLAHLLVLAKAICRAFKNTIPQLSELGNNSQSLDLETGQLEIGNAVEPGMLHFHVVIRGNPSQEFANRPLKGPNPGEIFDMRGTGEEGKIEGNKIKLKWSAGSKEETNAELRRVALIFRRNIPEDTIQYLAGKGFRVFR